MMSKPQQIQPKLFYHGIALESRIPNDHPLRKIKQLVDFNFVRSRVGHFYGTNGNCSIDPAVLLKLMFLLFYENIKSERQLMKQLPLRLDWLWFCDYDIDDPTPNHSVLSKARNRWGQDVFNEFFANILCQCIDAGLVDGEVIHLDSTMINANASKDKLQAQLRIISDNISQRLDEEISEQTNDDDHSEVLKPSDRRINPADPDARIGKKYSKSTLGYKDHRSIDDKNGIITSTITTPANVNDGTVLQELVETHQENTSVQAKKVAADKIYGTINNYKYLCENGIKSCIPHQRHGCQTSQEFSHDKFIYDRQNDCYICPASQVLERYDKNNPRDNAYRYRAKRAVCEGCKHFQSCVSSKHNGRQVSRNVDVEYVEWADNCLSSTERRRLSSRRWHRAEGSFADAANNHGYKRARWRRMWRVWIQNLMIAAIQNLRKLLKVTGGKNSAASACSAEAASILGDFTAKLRFIWDYFCGHLASQQSFQLQPYNLYYFRQN